MAGPNRILQSWIKAIGRLLVLVALLAILQEGVRLYLTARLKVQLQAPLPAGYVLDFKRTQLNWRQQALQIHGLSLNPEVKLPQQVSQVALMLPSIRLDLQSIFSSLKNKRLIIDAILIERPRIRLEQADGQPSNFTQSSLQVIESLSQYLSLLKIQTLEVKKAQLEHIQWRDSVPQRLQFEEINLFMSGFSVDSTLRRHSFFNADQVYLEILGQSLMLPQKDHILQFDTLRLSTKEGQIRFSGLTLESLQAKDSTGSQFTIRSPQIRLENIDFNASYLTQVLHIGRLQIQAPQIHFAQQAHTKTAAKTLRPLKDAISQLAKRLHIEVVEIQQAHIDLNLKEENATKMRFDIDSILINDFVVDSSTTFSDVEQLPFQDIELYLSNIRQYLNPQTGPLRIEKVQLNSSEKRIKVEGLQLGDEQLRTQRFYQSIPFIQFDGIDIFDILLKRKAAVQQISCFEPLTNIRPGPKDSPSTPDHNFYATLSNFFRDFFLKKITTQELFIHNGQIHIQNKLTVQQYNYRGQGIHLDQNAVSWSRIVPSFTCQATNYTFETNEGQKISGDSWQINGQEAQLYGLSVSSQALKVRTSMLDFQGLKIDSLFAGSLYADSLQIDRPQISYREVNTASPGRLSLPVHIPLVILNRGKIVYQNAQADTLRLQDFDGVFALQDSLTLRFSRFTELSVSPQSGTHRLQVQSGRQLDEHFSFEFSDVRLVPLAGRSLQDSSLFIPNLRVYDWDQAAWQKDSLLRFQKIIIDQPRTNLVLPDTLLFSREAKTKIPLQLDTLLLFNAQFGVAETEARLSWSFPSVTLALYGLQLPAKQRFPSVVGTLLAGLDSGLQVNHPDFTLSTAPVFYSSKLKNIKTDAIWYQSKGSTGLVKANIAQVDARGLDLDQLLQQDNWQLAALEIDSADLHYIKDSSTTTPQFFTERWPRIQVRQLELNNIDARLELDPLVEVQDLSLSATALQLDSTWQSGQFENAWQSLSTSVRKVSFSPDEQKHYQLLFGLQYASDDQRLQFCDPELRRNLSTRAFARQLDYRTDYWQLQAEQLVAHDFHPRQLFRDSFHFPKITVRQLVAHDYNDETIPLRADYKAMLPDQIKALSIPFLIDTLAVTGDIIYSAIAPLTSDSSWISFNRINGRIYHLTNIPRYFDQDMRLVADARLYEHAPLEVEMQFQLDRSPTTFELSGVLQDLELQRLNPILRAQTAMVITQGQSSKLLFNLAANDSVAVGELLFRYKKLRVQLLDKEDLTNRSFGNSFLSFWTNRLIQSRNPNWLRRRKGIIFFRRDQQKAIPHYWAHSILSGIVSSIGVKNTRRRLRKADLNVDSFSYETLLKEQLKRPRSENKQE